MRAEIGSKEQSSSRSLDRTPDAPPLTHRADLGTSHAWFALSALFLSLMLLKILIFPLVTHPDVALYLQCGGLLLQGQRPYVDFIDLNPPLIMYLNVIPAWLALWTGFNSIFVLQLTVLGCLLGSVWALDRLLRRSEFGPELIGLMTILWLLYSWAQLFAFDEGSLTFGQREHLFLLTFVPFIVVRWLRYEGRPLTSATSLLTGFLAGVGICLKPHFLVVFALAEACGMASTRKWRALFAAELLACMAAGFLYAIHFLLLPHEVRESFFVRWVPFIARYYHVYDLPLSVLVRSPMIWASFALALSVWFFCADRPEIRLARMLSCSSVGGIVVYFLQRKGWNYHAVPAVGLSFFILPLLVSTTRLGDIIRGLWSRGSVQRSLERFCWAGCLLAALLCIWRASNGVPKTLSFADESLGELIARDSSEGETVVFINTSISAYPLMVQLSRSPGSRYLWSFPIAMYYCGITGPADGPFPYRVGDAQPPEEQRYLHELEEDINNRKPRLVLIYGGSALQGCPKRFMLYDYFKNVGFIDRALGAYERQRRTTSGYYVFTRRS